MEIKEIRVADLVKYENNAKIHTAEQVKQIARSIQEFGNCDPIAVWTNEHGKLEIVEGHGRALALKFLGEETAPVITLDHLSDVQRRAYTHVHNQLTLNSGFDYDKIMAELNSSDFDFSEFGFAEYLQESDFSKRMENKGAEEIDLEEYAASKFDCHCPQCGMRFDLR